MAARRWMGGLLLAAGLSACGGPWSAEEFEIANMRSSNFVPKSSPGSLVATFERHCLDRLAEPMTIGPSLLAADYVRVPPSMARGGELYVVDDRRPSVMVERTPGRTSCAVAVSSRTGQTARARRMVERRFPGAVPLPPWGRMEAMWRVGPGGRTLLFLGRDGTPSTPASLILGAISSG